MSTVNNMMDKTLAGNPASGWIILDKPLGMSSHTATNKVKKHLNADKAGHCGTLDPLASGVLPIALNHATKLVDYVVASHKSYDFSILWGAQTTTDDAEGEVIAQSDHRPTEADIAQAIPQFIGDIMQIPPDFSALKIQGKPAYARARAGETKLHQPRAVTVHNLKLIHHRPEKSSFTLDCGKGVYVRSIARDLALKLGTFGHVGDLRRTAVGRCKIENAISLEKIFSIGHTARDLSFILPLTSLLDDILVIEVTAAEADFLAFGRTVTIDAARLGPNSSDGSIGINTETARQNGHDAVLAYYGGDLVALGRWEGNNFSPRRVFMPRIVPT
ncbi:MAG: tRNA pseudouridine(55) synthase TruB [Candidatus Symbiobacter sp.]|nr:tRNA pseudouridine(55) synthase TruB [Candidatus Symbiobacter sp.]